MDKDFEKKVKRKRIRTAAVGLIVIALAVYLILDMKVEKADYSQSLIEEIETAEQLHADNYKNTGNEKGQYAQYTLLTLYNQTKAAKEISESKDSEYNDKKEAYEKLKEQVKAFKNAENSDVVEKAEAEKLAKEKRSADYTVEIKDGKEMRYHLDGGLIKAPTTINLMAREEGPYYEQINEILGKLSLQGQVISFYQEGSFGGKVQGTVPIYSQKKTKGYAYKVDLKAGKLKYVSDAKIDLKGQTATFDLSEGGDYVVLTKKIHKDAKKSVDIKKAEKEAKDDKKTSSSKDDTGSNDNSGGSSSPATTPEEKNIAVSIEIRCDTLANDLSKLEDPALEAYVPSDGTILATTKVTVKKGSTVYDVLNRVCRNKGIHVEASYTPTYGSYYVEGINYLYEFDGGKLSGWMYKVNGSFPNYGSSEYTLKDGDKIVWVYTCDLGKDVGDNSMS